MRHDFKEVVTVRHERIVGSEVRCDVCKKMISEYRLNEFGNPEFDVKSNYFKVKTGNEMNETSMDICSIECLNKVFDTYISENKEKPS